jgi:hypothetical protein
VIKEMPTMRTRFALAILTSLVALGVLATSALALYPQLSAKLTGPAIGGVTPEGDAKVDQSKYPSVPPRLDVRVKNVNLPDGTTLFVGVGCEYHSCLDYRKAGTFALRGREGSFTGSLQTQVGRQTSITVSTADGIVRVSNPGPMNP